MLKLSRFGIVVLFIALVGLCLVVTDSSQAAPQKGGTIIEAMGTEPTNLDCFKAARRPEYTVLHLMFEPLFVVNPDLKIDPMLVESYKSSPDAVTWTFVIKKGIKFHDGTTLNAEAVKFSLEKHIKGSQGRFIKIVKEITVKDPYTVVMTLKKPNPLLLNALSSPNIGMVSPTAYNKAPKQWGSKVIVGTGPMMFKEWRSGDRVIMVRNPDYKHAPAWTVNKGPAYVDKWIIRFLPEPTTLIAELTVGAVDLSDYVTERDVKRVKKGKKTNLIVSPSTSAIFLAINTKNPPFNDIKIREAAAHAISAGAVRKAAMNDIGAPLYTPISFNILGFWKPSDDIGKPLVKYDPEKAKAILEAAGWKDTNGDGVREKDGKELFVNFLAFNIARYKRMGEVATPMLEKAGFKVKLQILEPGDLYQRTLAGKHNLLSTGLVGSLGFAVDDLVSSMHSGSLGNISQWCHYSNPEIDKLLDNARYSSDPKKREEALNAAQKMAAAEIIVIPMANAMEIFGYKKNLGGVDNYLKHPWAFDQADAYRALEIYKK